MSRWDERFEGIRRHHLPFLEDGQPLDPDRELAGLGLDSMGTIQLLIDIEETFDIVFPDESLTPETFATPSSPWGVACELLEVRPGHATS